jgi:hypothetical protein
MMLGGAAAAVGTAAALGVDGRAAAMIDPVIKNVENATSAPTTVEGMISEPDEGIFTAAFRALNQNLTRGTGLHALGSTFGVYAVSQGAGVFSRSEAGGIAVDAWVDGDAALAPAGPESCAVMGRVSDTYTDVPAFFARSRIAMRFEEEATMPSDADLTAGDLVVLRDGAAASWVVTTTDDPAAPSHKVKVAVPGAAGAFVPLPAPVRAYDSRPGNAPATGVKSPLMGGVDRVIELDGASAGAVPSDATGVVVNLTIANASGRGFAAVFPGGATYGGTSSINFDFGQVVANAVVSGLGPNASITLRAGEAGVTVDAIVDIVGYYA